MTPSDKYLELISFQNLYKAHRKARLGKRNKKEVIDFEMNLSQNLWSLYYDLKYFNYKVSGYHKFMIYDPKEREIQAITYRDRIVQHTLCDNYLMPRLEKYLIKDNVACRINKGTGYAVKRVREFLTKSYKRNINNGYLIKLDISKYFPSIDHDVLKQKISKLKLDESIETLLTTIIDSYNYDSNKGLPMENQTSQCFALLYLSEVDRYIKEVLQVKSYIRYMDDMLLFVDTKNKAQTILNLVKNKIEEDKLKLNKKSQIIKLHCGFDFLAWHFSYSSTGRIIQTIKQNTKHRIIEKCKSIKIREKQNAKIKYIVKCSYEGLLLLKHDNSYEFMNMLNKHYFTIK